MPTGREVRLAVARTLKGLLPDGDRLFYEFVNTAVATSSLTDAVNLASSKFTAQEFENFIVRWSDNSNAAPDGDKVRATTLVGSTGVLSVSPDLSAAAANGDTGELYKAPLDPDNIDMAIDRALTQDCTRWRLAPLGLLKDPDYLVAAVTGTPADWPATNANRATVAGTGMERFSERLLQVANTGADGYAAQTVNTNKGESASEGEAEDYFFAALVKADVGSASPILYDLSNSAALTLTGERTSWAGEGFQLIKASVTVPASCEQVSVRLHGAGATDDVYWGPVSFYPKNATEFALPPRITSVSQVGKTLVEWVGDDYPERAMRDVAVQPRIFDGGGGNIRVQLNDGPIGERLLYFREFATYGVLRTTYNTALARRAGDQISTLCPLDYIVWATLRQMYPGKFEREFNLMHRRHGARTEHGIQYPQGVVRA